MPDALPEPLTPPACDLRKYPFIPLELRRLLTSETWILGTGEERAAAIALWLESWHQVPAASLPDDDRMLEHLSQSKKWKGVRAHVLRGWIKCSDGRLYHSTVAEKALEVWIDKLMSSVSGSAGNAKRWGTEVDTDVVEAQIVDAAARLRAIAPRSEILSKTKVRNIVSRSHPDDENIAPRLGSRSPPDQKCIAVESPPDEKNIRSDRNREGEGNKKKRKDKNNNPLPPAGAGSSDSLPAAGLFAETGTKAPRPEKAAKVTALSCSDLVADGVSEQTANEFLDLRRKKRAALTPGAWAGIKAEAAKAGWSVQDAVAKCVTRGWQGFDAEWLTPKQGGSRAFDNEAENARAKQMLFGPDGSARSSRRRETDRRIAEFLADEREPFVDDGMTIDMEPAAEAFTLPSWVPVDAWNAFVEMRKGLGKPMSASAMGLAVTKLDELKAAGNDPAAVLNQSTLGSYQGLFELKGQHGKSTTQHGNFASQDYHAGVGPDGSF